MDNVTCHCIHVSVEVGECHCRHVSVEVHHCSWTFFRVSLTINELACQAMLMHQCLSMACSTYNLGHQQHLACKNSIILLSGHNLRKFHDSPQVWSPISGSASIYLHIAMHILMSFHLLSSDNILHLKFKFLLCSLWFEADINWMVSICAFQFNLDFILISIWNGQINMLTCPFNDKNISGFSASTGMSYLPTGSFWLTCTPQSIWSRLNVYLGQVPSNSRDPPVGSGTSGMPWRWLHWSFQSSRPCWFSGGDKQCAE